MSQLYQLFCEGLLDRESAILSSTFMTSTPLEEEEDEAVHSGPGPAGPAASPSIAQLLRRNSESDHEDLGVEKDAEKQTPEYSVQGQVGSASESPPVDDPVGVNSPVAAVVSQGLQATPDEAVSSQKQQDKDIASQLSRHSVQRNPNVSPVDFVDRIIAAKRWDDAFAKKPKHIATCSQSSDESLVQHDKPAIEHRKVNDELSDSSETDFEGASEYYRSRQTQNSTTQQNSLGQNKNLPKKCSLSSNEESNMQLVMECISSENSSPNCLLNPECQNSVTSAARCRVYIRSKDGKAKSANRQPDPLPKNDHEGIQMRTAKVVLNDILNTQQAGIATADTNNSKSITVLNGVTAYVEVRSGHDNRSMGVRTQLRNLGAKVLEKFSSEITHVVFNEGAPSTLRKARKQGCHLVSVLWIDECKKLGRMVPEADHPPLDLHLYDEPGAYRKMKSFQPDFEEGKAEERQKKQLERLKARSQKATSSQQPSSQSSSSGEESFDDVSEETHPKLKIPDGVALKTFSIVLKKIDAIDSSGVSITSAKKKRKLLPLRQHLPASLSLDFDDFDPAVRVRPPFPYSQSSASQKKRNVPPRRIVKYQSSSSQNLRRRSSCFVRGTPCLSGSKPKKVKAKIPTMVCTFMHRREIDVVAAVIKQLGGWILEPTVSPRTTHVVCGDSKRTINLLRGIAHGCWIIRQEWVLRSLEAGHWLDEEPFELTEFPAVQQSRIARETLGAAPDIFSSAGCIYVSKDSTPPHFELVDLLQLCGGNVVKSVRQAKVIIGPYLRPIDVTHVKEQWVLDSIQENMLQPTRNYRL